MLAYARSGTIITHTSIAAWVILVAWPSLEASPSAAKKASTRVFFDTDILKFL